MIDLHQLSDRWRSSVAGFGRKSDSRPASAKDRIGTALRAWSTECSTPEPALERPPDTEVHAPSSAPAPEGQSVANETIETIETQSPIVALEAVSGPSEEATGTFQEPWAGEGTDTVDYYEVLQISPNADSETIHRVYRLMAARFHPDNPTTGNQERFVRLGEAYKVLCDQARRSAHDAALASSRGRALAVFGQPVFGDGVDGEKNRRLGILSLLYHQRRIHEERPGLSVLEIEEMMAFPREYLQFTLWYLKSKDYIQLTDASSDFMVTARGVDYLESRAARSSVVRDLLAAGSGARNAEKRSARKTAKDPFVVPPPAAKGESIQAPRRKPQTTGRKPRSRKGQVELAAVS
jgi:curved DNA-binding protein CbpA